MGRLSEDHHQPRTLPRRQDIYPHEHFASFPPSVMSYPVVNGDGHHARRSSDESMTTPICRCRVIYLGSAVPHVTKDGLQGIQEPLRDLYPDQGLLMSQNPESIGIDSWLSVWSNGILIENVDESGREVKKFFPIDSLHYCAAVRYVVIPSHVHGGSVMNGGSQETPTTTMRQPTNGSSSETGKINGMSSESGSSESSKIKFLPLDSPFSRNSNITLHPPLFACILRRTTGIKVLECHAFICKRDQAANALVRCCFHAYADSMHARQMEQEFLDSQSNLGGRTNESSSRRNSKSGLGSNGRRFSRSISDLDTVENKIEAWRQRSSEALNLEEIEVVQSTAGHHDPDIDNDGDDDRESSSISRQRRLSHHIPRIDPGDTEQNDNYKVWSGGPGPGPGPGLAMMYSASTPHLPHLHQRQVSAPFLRTPHHPHHLHPLIAGGHDGRATLRSTRTTVSSALHRPHPSHPLFPAPSLSSRSMINLAGPHPPPPFHLLPGPPPPPLPGHPHHLPPFLPVPTTLSKKELKSLKSSMKKMKKKNKGQDTFILPPPPFLRGPLPPPPHVLPFLVPGPHPRGLPFPPPPPPGHPHLMCPVDDSMYSTSMRPLTPVSVHHQNGFSYPPQLDDSPHNVYATARRDGGKPSSRRSSSQSQSRQPDSNSEDPPDSDHLNMGIYRKKANLNERAFSYSIRQESRSRSGSVANVQYSGNESGSGIISNGGRSSPHNHHHPSMMKGNGHRLNGHHDHEIIAQSLENLNISNGRSNHHHPNHHQERQNQNQQNHRNGKSSTSSHSSLHSNHIQHQALMHSGQEESHLPQNNYKTASIKRGSGTSLHHHLQNGSSSGSKVTPVPMPPPPPIVSNGRPITNSKK